VNRQSFEKKLEALEALRSTPGSAGTVDQVRKALRDRNNYYVSKAAAIAGDLLMSEMVPDLIAAFERFLVDPVKADPQCWAKNAIAKALKGLGHCDPAVFLRGLVHFQPEPIWGGQSDTAPALRGTCALALIQCQLDDRAILTHLTDALADPEKPVRLDAAMAIAQLARPEGALLLRLKALAGDPEPEVTGQCLAALVSLEPQASVEFVGRFLKAADEDVRSEAVGALAKSREAEAFQLLKNYWRTRLSPEMRRVVLTSLGASPLPEAAEFLVTAVKEEPTDVAVHALEALGVSRFRLEVGERVAAIVEDRQEARLRHAFEQEFRKAGEV